MTKLATKTPKYAYALVRKNKMADSYASSFDVNSEALRRSCFTILTTFQFNRLQC